MYNFSYEDIVAAIRVQQDQLVALDMKVTATIETVVNLGDHVIQQSGEISELRKDMDVLDERVEDVEEDLGETKVKVEEIDNKVTELQTCIALCKKDFIAFHLAGHIFYNAFYFFVAKHVLPFCLVFIPIV